MTDQELVEGIEKQDRNAIHILVTRYQQKVIKTAFYLVKDIEDAEDLSQEVFMEVIRSIHRYKRKATLYTWIYRITINKSLDLLRKKKQKGFIQKLETMTGFSIDGRPAKGHEPAVSETRFELKEKRDVLDKAINSLPENQKIAFTLNKFDDLSYKDIAEIMNLSLSAVESLIHRAKMNLQKKLADYYY
jgi:RNA polymerase sigma-70 factor, ECF subfamily